MSKQLLQNLRTGSTSLEELPYPSCGRHDVVIASSVSIISPGTERMLLNFSKASFFQKAKQQPEKVKMVVNKIKSDGLLPTLEAVFSKLSEPLPLGYSNVGTVVEIGDSVSEFKVGDRVVSNGAHSEVVCVGKNLVSKIPDNVSNDEAAFTVIASISLQGIRVCQPTIGETIAVIGLGLIGQITCEILSANGCNVIGFDIDSSKVELAKSRGFNAYNSGDIDIFQTTLSLTQNRGVDATIITASTSSNNPIEDAGEITRKNGRVVVVGAVRMDIPRNAYYYKELKVFLATSYGPGRYDENYECNGQDYPINYVRWTEQRNFEAILQLMESQKLSLSHLITARCDFSQLDQEYGVLLQDHAQLAVVIRYPSEQPQLGPSSRRQIVNESTLCADTLPAIGMIGAGNYSRLILLPILKKTGSNLIGIVSKKGLSSTLAAKRFGFNYTSTDINHLIDDSEINTLVVAMKPGQHSAQITAGLHAGKHVFVEKPLAVNLDQLNDVIAAVRDTRNMEKPPLLMAGFNRRFSPLAQKVKSSLISRSAPITIHANINAGFIPYDEWCHDPNVGGGRIIMEGCHFIDLMSFFTDSEVVSVSSTGMGSGHRPVVNDNVSIHLTFLDGSLGVINYFSNGHKAFPKENYSIFSEGRVFEIDNWKSLKGYGVTGLRKLRQQKGHYQEIITFLDAIQQGKSWPISFDSMVNTTLATFAHVKSLELGRCVSIDELRIK